MSFLKCQCALVLGRVLCGILVIGATSGAAAQEWGGPAPISSPAHLQRQISQAEAAARAHPNDAETLLSLVRLYDLNGDFRKSVPVLRKVVNLQPDNLNANRLLGTDLFHIGDYTEALKPLRTVVAVDRNDGQTNFYLGLCYLALDRNDEAGKAFAGVAANAPANMDELYFLVQGYSRLSSAMLTRLAALGKNSYRMDEIRGKYFELQNAPEQAIKEYEAAVQLRPDLASLHYVLGDAYWKLSQLNKAAAEFQRAVELAPQHFMAHYNLGKVLLEQNKLADALKEFRTALSEQPGLVDGYLEVGKVLYQEGHYHAAIPQLQRYVKLSRDSPTPHYLLFQIYRRLNDAVDANKQLNLFKQTDAIMQAKKRPRIR